MVHSGWIDVCLLPAQPLDASNPEPATLNEKDMEDMTEEFEKLGQAIDRVDNLAHALRLNLPPQMHVDSLKNLLPDIVKELKESFVKVAGENPWE
jgi:hypothetical protein